MHILAGNLIKKLNDVDKILIYGAGNYANIVYPILKKAGLREKVCSFVVTNLTEQGEIDGIPIKSFSEFKDTDFEKYEVLVAVGREYEQEIIQFLQQYNFSQILRITDYMLSDDVFFEMLKKQSNEEFLEGIINENIWNGINTKDELQNKKILYSETISKRDELSVDRNTILFISGDLTPRTIKIIGALSRKKKNIVVLLFGNVNELMKYMLTSRDIKIFQCKSIFEVFYRAMTYKPLVYYYEPIWGDCNGAEIMIRHKELFGKIVFASYDVLNDGYAFVSEEQKMAEKYVLENADGVVWRWFSKEFLAEAKGFEYQGSSIQFLDYCNGYELESKQNTNELRLCFVAGSTYGVFDEKEHKNDNRYIEIAKMDDIMKSIGKRTDCIFHVFFGKINKKDRKKAEELSREYPNFRFFCGTRYDELIPRISEYDYGCYWSTSGEEMPLQKFDDQGFTGSNYMNAVSNRYFDYLDAGVPIIAVQPKKICEYLDKYGVIVKMNVSNINIEYLKEKRPMFKKNVEKAKKELLIDNHIDKLIDFFNKL